MSTLKPIRKEAYQHQDLSTPIPPTAQNPSPTKFNASTTAFDRIKNFYMPPKKTLPKMWNKNLTAFDRIEQFYKKDLEERRRINRMVVVRRDCWC